MIASSRRPGTAPRHWAEACARRPHGGVTLLELLVAVTILGVIAALLYGTFSRTLLGRDRATAALERYASARAALDWLARDLEGGFAAGLYPTGAKRFVGGRAANAPTVERTPLLDITATSALSILPLIGPALPEEARTEDRGDQVRVLYHLEKPATDDAIGLDLVRYEYRPPTLTDELDDASRAVITHGVAALELRYFDGATWHEDWDSTASSGGSRGIAPRVVEARVRIANSEGEPIELVSAVYLTMGGRHRG